MKVKKWIASAMILMTMAGFVFAQAQSDEKSDDAQRGRRRDMRPARAAERPRSTAGREQRYQARMAQQGEVHAAEIKELMDIKKIAEEENATKTAAAIQALINKKNAEYQQRIEQLERVRRERAEQLKERREKLEARREGSRSPRDKSRENGEKADEAEKD